MKKIIAVIIIVGAALASASVLWIWHRHKA